jgi:hypothetical protein
MTTWVVICRNKSWGPRAPLGWAVACNPPIKIFGELIIYNVHARRASRTEWATRAEAETAAEGLMKSDKRYGFTFEVVEAGSAQDIPSPPDEGTPEWSGYCAQREELLQIFSCLPSVDRELLLDTARRRRAIV